MGRCPFHIFQLRDLKSVLKYPPLSLRFLICKMGYLYLPYRLVLSTRKAPSAVTVCSLVRCLEFNKCELALESNASTKTGLASASNSWQEQGDSISFGSYQRKQRSGVCPSGLCTWGNQGWKRGLSRGCSFRFFSSLLGFTQANNNPIRVLWCQLPPFPQECSLRRWKKSVFKSSPKRQPFPAS